jgi:hypothetical protein
MQPSITPQRVENALLLLATIIASREPEFAARVEPIYDRMEREFASMKRDDVRARAMRRLAAHNNAGG